MSLISGYDDDELAFKIDNEGFDYFFNDYLSTKDVKDAELRRLIDNYQDASEALRYYLEKKGVAV